MWIESVTAKAFGPLRDSTLELQPGLNVIVGRNESAKSTWHAAIYAAICGRARRKGPPTKEEREFAEQYRPWHGETWHVEARLRLDDDRRVEIHHELNQAVDCAAIDLGLGRDVSAEIMHAGAPDASRWLGMNRSVFAATACVRQSEILTVLDSAGGLQQQLEAAATHAGTSDPTAAQAIALIKKFRSENVGKDLAHSTKPLRRAKSAVERAGEELKVAREKHNNYLTLVAEAARLQSEADRLSSARATAAARVRRLDDLVSRADEADKAQAEADRLGIALENAEADAAALQERLGRARELDRELGGREPAGNHVSEQLVADVAQALAQWKSRPRPVALHGPDADELQRQVDALPQTPSGDVTCDPAVEAAASALDHADVLLRATLEDRPAPLAEPSPALRQATSVSAATLRDWASRLDTIEVVAPEDIQAARERETAAQESLTSAGEDADEADLDFENSLQSGRPSADRLRTPPAVLVGAVAALIAGVGAVVLFIAGNPAAGGGLAAVAALAAVGTFVVHTRVGSAAPEKTETSGTVTSPRQRKEAAHDRLLQAQKEFLEAQSSLKELENDARDAATSRSDIEARCEARGLPTDAHSLRVLAGQVDQRQSEERAVQQWEGRRDRDQDAVTSAEKALSGALQARGVDGSDVRGALEQYVTDCDARAKQASESAKRQGLERALKARQRDEEQVEHAIAAAQTSATALGEAASRAGLQVGEVTVDDAEDVVSALEQWQQARETATRELDAQRRKWTDLQTQLNGLTLSGLEASTQAKAQAVAALREKSSTATSQAEALWDQLRQQAAEMTVKLPDDRAAIAGVLTDLVSDANRELNSLNSLLEDALGSAHDAQGQQKNAAKHLPSVPEAEERLQTCEAELERVQVLGSTLDVVRRHLLDAQETVHRNIAPTLQKTLVQWLPAVTEDRYTDAAVDPETLDVTIRAGSDWVPAQRLSFGTAEQIYLLLRVALVTHISTPGTSCPMLLDDVTVQADEIRTQALLDTLATLATERQIVLFAQEPLVEQWAQEQIAAGKELNLITLEQVPIG